MTFTPKLAPRLAHLRLVAGSASLSLILLTAGCGRGELKGGFGPPAPTDRS